MKVDIPLKSRDQAICTKRIFLQISTFSKFFQACLLIGDEKFSVQTRRDYFFLSFFLSFKGLKKFEVSSVILQNEIVE